MVLLHTFLDATEHGSYRRTVVFIQTKDYRSVCGLVNRRVNMSDTPSTRVISQFNRSDLFLRCALILPLWKQLSF